MTIQNRWATMLTLAGLAAGAITVPHAVRAAPVPGRTRLPPEGVDYTPIGSAHAVQALNARRLHGRQR